MAYNNSFTAVTGATYTAAQYNTYVRDNFTAIWVYTTAGDLAYATSSTALSRLAIGTAYKFLQVNSAATAPQWGGLHFASVYHNTTQNVATATATILTFNSENSDAQGWHSTVSNTGRITVSAAGYYQASAYFNYTSGGGSGNYWDVVYLTLNGSNVAINRKLQQVDANTKYFAITFPIISASATNYFEVWLEQNSGGTQAVQSGALFTLLRIS